MGPATRAEAVRRWEACFGNWGRWAGEGQTQLSQQASSFLGEAESGTPNSLLYVQIGLWELSLNLRKTWGVIKRLRVHPAKNWGQEIL